MDAARRQIDRVLEEVLTLEESKRQTFLDEVCAGNLELREEVDTFLGVEAVRDWSRVGVVGPYQIEARLGSGGMGAVYRARDERLGRVVAIKMLLERRTGDPVLLRRFTQEVRVSSSLKHPNIVTVYDVGEVDGQPYLVTEYVDGESLKERIGRGMRVEEAIDVAAQVAEALTASHAAGVIHRDVKPANVMVRGDGLVKLLDFGIAKLMEGTEDGDEPSTELTQPGTVMGTVGYMSPEQSRGQRIDGRTDVWSLGVMLYEMVAGRPPFQGPTRADVLVEVLSGSAKRVAAMPDVLAKIVDRALSKQADERYATMEEMGSALAVLRQRLADGEPITDEGAATTDEHDAGTDERTLGPTNLPEGDERLIGRDRELREIVDELRGTRLLTLTGPGGTGKTRLAREAGRALLAEFEDGVFFVELAAIRDPALVASAVAETLGVKEGAGATPDEALVRFLAGRELLLVLDNFEQVVDAADLVARLLSQAPRVKALVTSRERLHQSAERELSLSPLSLPPADMATDEELEGYGAVALFVERARFVRAGFGLKELSAANRSAVVEICRRLDGLPLAIELAAARLRLLTPDVLLGRLDRQLKLLTGGARDLPERQQTMRAAIAWSYELLDGDERRLFERLSVFADGWTLDAAEALAPDEGVLDLMTQLADKSLVVVEERDDEMRCRMLETIRQYAAERLVESGEERRVRAEHAGWFLELVETGAKEYLGTAKVRMLARLDRERENVRAALAWSAEESPEMLLRLSAAMGRVWAFQGRWSEGRSWLERALAADGPPSLARATALNWLGELARWQSDLERARTFVTESIAMYRELGDRSNAGRALGELGTIVQNLGDLDAADAMLREALAQYDDPADARMRALVFARLGTVAYDREDFEAVESFNEQALAIFRDIDDRDQVANTLYNLGVMAERRRAYEHATTLLEESLVLARESGKRPLAARVIHYLGKVAGGQGDYGRAAELRAEATREYRAIGDRHMLTFLFEEVMSELIERGQSERAARLLGAQMRLGDTGELPRSAYGGSAHEARLASVREALGEREAARSLARGRLLSLDEALKLAFEG